MLSLPSPHDVIVEEVWISMEHVHLTICILFLCILHFALSICARIMIIPIILFCLFFFLFFPPYMFKGYQLCIVRLSYFFIHLAPAWSYC